MSRSPLRDRSSPNHDPRPAGVPVDTLVLHYTGMRDARAALDRLCDAQARVSSHYVVDEDGTTFRLVDEARRARHAGISHWRGQDDLNGRSVGIEIVNPGHEHGYRDFPPPQVAAVTLLCLGVLGRHPIPPRNVVAHSDIAPDRKEDPGERFPWAALAEAGVGLWPGQVPDLGTHPVPAAEAAGLPATLAEIGYRVEGLALPVLLRAFQRHWRPEAVTGLPDRGTLARALAVAQLVAG